MPDATNQDMILGEMRGQLRELVHSTNNLSMKFDALSREVIGLGPLAADVAELKIKVDTLETDRARREGQAGILGTIARSPALGWLVGAAITAWAILTGKVDV